MVGGERENEGSGSLRVWQCTACATNTRVSDDDDNGDDDVDRGDFDGDDDDISDEYDDVSFDSSTACCNISFILEQNTQHAEMFLLQKTIFDIF